jgi:hypothetical protein
MEASMKFSLASAVWVIPVGLIAIFILIVAIWHFFAWVLSPFPSVTGWFDKVLRKLGIYSP